MRKFLAKALQNLHKLPREQVHSLMYELAGENDLLAMVLSSIPGGVIVAGQDNRVLFVNSQARRFFSPGTGQPSGKRTAGDSPRPGNRPHDQNGP